MSSNINDELKNLENGKFNKVNLDLRKWIVDSSWDNTYKIMAFQKGAFEKKDILNFALSFYIIEWGIINFLNEDLTKEQLIENIENYSKTNNNHYKNMNIEDLKDLWKRIGIKKYENLMSSNMYFLNQLYSQNKDNEVLKQIIFCASNSINDITRLYCCCSIDNPICFINDVDKRISKVANTRIFFEKIWNNYLEEEKELILFLTKLISNNSIIFHDGLASNNNKCCFSVESSIFEDNNNWIYNFDRDIVFNITDKRLIASEIYMLLLKQKIKFKTGQEPKNYIKLKNKHLK